MLYRQRLLIMVLTLVTLLFDLFNGLWSSHRIKQARDAAVEAKVSAVSAQQSAEAVDKKFTDFDKRFDERATGLLAATASTVIGKVNAHTDAKVDETKKDIFQAESGASAIQMAQLTEIKEKILAEFRGIQNMLQSGDILPGRPSVTVSPQAPVTAPPGPPPAPPSSVDPAPPSEASRPQAVGRNAVWVEPRATIGSRDAPIKKSDWVEYQLRPGEHSKAFPSRLFEAKRIGLSGGPIVMAKLIYSGGRGEETIRINTSDPTFNILGADKVVFYSNGSFSVWIKD